MNIKKRFWVIWKLIVQTSKKRVKKHKVILITGMQRSGTNMLMESLDKSYQTKVFHDWEQTAFDSYMLRESTIITKLIKQNRTPLIVFKTLFETPKLTHLLTIYNPAQAVWIVRHFDDVVNSMVRSFGNMSLQIEMIISGKASESRHAINISTKTVEEIKKYYFNGIDEYNSCALLWYIRNTCYFEGKYNDNPNVLLLVYEDFVTSPSKSMQDICLWLDIAFSNRMVNHIHNHSINRNSPSNLKADIRYLCDELWHRLISC